MPSADEILESLARTANAHLIAAVLWHVVLAAALGALVLGWRPSPRAAPRLLAPLPASVSVLAFLHGNLFNAIALGLLAALLLTGGRTVRSSTLTWRADRWVGAALIAFGWIYPHFLIGLPFAAYAIAAPTGVLPCPTLAVVTGFVIVRRDALPTAVATVVAAYGIFYGLFGTLRLGVWIDLVLLLGAVALAASIARERSSTVGRC